jgi:hypothetical protein
MQVLEKDDNKIAPRSLIRHRPIGNAKPSAGQRSVVTSAATPVAQRASRLRQQNSEEIEDGVIEWQRAEDETHSSKPSNPARRATASPKPLPKTPQPKQSLSKKSLGPHAHPLLYLGIGMLAMLILWTLLMFVVGWFNTTMDDIHYGRPRTFQIDAVVGHNDSQANPSHFIAINLNRRIEIIEMPGGDASHARIYLGPQLYGEGEDLTPVTLSFIDVNGDHKPDMIIHFQTSQIVFINDQGGFRPLRPEERAPVEQFLQHLGQ